jgi:hypothetical protein
LKQRALIRPSGTFSHSLKRERAKGKLSGIIPLARSEGMGEGGRRPGEGLSPRGLAGDGDCWTSGLPVTLRLMLHDLKRH